jgi:hypothetical protein
MGSWRDDFMGPASGHRLLGSKADNLFLTPGIGISAARCA